MVTVLCLEIEPGVMALLQRQRRPPILREAASPEHLIAALEHDPTATESVLLGKDIPDPLRLVHHAHALDPDLALVLLASTEFLPVLREAIGFLPSLQGDVVCAGLDDVQALPALIDEAARRTQRRRLVRAQVRAVAELEEPHPAPLLARMLDAGPLAVVVLNSQGRIAFANPSAVDLLDPLHGRALGRAFALFFPEPEWETLSHFLAQCSVTERRIPAQVFHREASAGRARELAISAAPFPGAKGERGTLVFLDVPAPLEAGAQNGRIAPADARGFATQHLLELASFAGDLGQALGPALASIVDGAELVAQEVPPDAAVLALLERIRVEGERAAEICDQLLTFGERKGCAFEPVDLGLLVQTTLRALEPSISRRIALHAELRPELPPVLADRALVTRALRSLIELAARAIGAHAGRIEIATGQAAPRPDRRLVHGEVMDALEPRVFLEVADDAREREPAGRLRAFDRRSHSRAAGADLALASVVGAARSLGASLEVDFPPRGGSALRVLFAPSGERSLDGVLAGRTILIVQHEECSRALAQRVLEHHGMTPRPARDAYEARALLHERASVDAVLLDLELLDAELLAALELQRPTAPVIVTGAERELEARARELGCTPAAALARPFSGYGLVRIVRHVLQEDAPQGDARTDGSARDRG